jgi:hypothetical protein
MRRDPLHSRLELTLVKEPQARGEEGDDCGRFMRPRREGCRGPRLVVVFQEAGQLILVVGVREEVLAYGPGVPLAEAVV